MTKTSCASLLVLLSSACSTPPGVSEIDPIHAPVETATPDYWFARPPSVVVLGNDYDRLWAACEAVATNRQFVLERRDYRNGVLTTRAIFGGQILEFWQRDRADPYSVVESNIATVRRTVQFELVTVGDTHEARPKVVVERNSVVERRVTLGILNRNAFSSATVTGFNDYDATVTPPRDYWYATRRDENLESELANEIRERMKG